MRRRKRNNGGIAVLILLALVLIAVVLLKFVLVVRSVELEGSHSASYEEIIRTARVEFGTSIFRVDEDEIRSHLESGGKYSLAGMDKRYPSTVVLKIHERERAAMMLQAGKILVLDAEGHVIEALPQAPDMDLVYVSGAEPSSYRIGGVIPMSQPRIEGYVAVMQALAANGAQYYVSELKLDDAEHMKIITRTGIAVELGGKENMTQKIAWMKSAVADLEARREFGGTLDVSSGTKADYRRAEDM